MAGPLNGFGRSDGRARLLPSRVDALFAGLSGIPQGRCRRRASKSCSLWGGRGPVNRADHSFLVRSSGACHTRWDEQVRRTRYPLLFKDRLQSTCRISKPFGAGEAVGEFRDDQVGLEHEEAVIPVAVGLGKQPGDLPFARAGGDVLMRLGVVILDMEMSDAAVAGGSQAVVDRLPDLDVIGRVERV